MSITPDDAQRIHAMDQHVAGWRSQGLAIGAMFAGVLEQTENPFAALELTKHHMTLAFPKPPEQPRPDAT